MIAKPQGAFQEGRLALHRDFANPRDAAQRLATNERPKIDTFSFELRKLG
jgi:hypothetical protein